MAHKKNEAMKKKRERYKKEGRMLTNKVKKLKKQLRQHPNDTTAKSALDKVKK